LREVLGLWAAKRPKVKKENYQHNKESRTEFVSEDKLNG